MKNKKKKLLIHKFVRYKNTHTYTSYWIQTRHIVGTKFIKYNNKTLCNVNYNPQFTADCRVIVFNT